MTPEEAVAELVTTGVISWREASVVRALVDAVATTAKAAETERLAKIANNILRTGGLKVEP